MARRIDGINNGAPATQHSGQASFALFTADPNGIKTSIATSTTAVTYSGADLNGAEITAGQLSGDDAHNVTVTLASNAGSYVASTSDATRIKVTGKHPYYEDYQGNKATHIEYLSIPDADGGVTLTCGKCFAPGEPLSIYIPGQVNTSGAIEIGTGAAREVSPPARWIQCNAVGTLYLHLPNTPINRSPDTGKIAKVVVSAAGPIPFAADAIHASSDITDLLAVTE